MRTELIFVADLHLSHAPPRARSHAADWYGEMAGQCDKLRALVATLNGEGAPPQICYVGDLFDAPRQPPEMLVHTLRILPRGLAVPGNHDLLHHRHEDRDRSAYGVLAAAGAVRDMEVGEVYEVGPFRLHPFPYRVPVTPPPPPRPGVFDVAVIHAYVWKLGRGHDRARDEDGAGVWSARLAGYSHAFFGDNHQQFLHKRGGCQIVNCGLFMRRRSDEAGEEPAAWALLSDGSVVRHPLGDGDVLPPEERPEASKSFGSFTGALTGEGVRVDFRERLLARLRLDKPPEGVGRRILAAMGGA